MVSVILCTYNRSQSLAKALDSIASETLPDRVEWEVLVVDNNSRDQTPEVVEAYRQRYPGRFRYAFEPQPGKSYALNTGIREARGDILAFMDDDVVVKPGWLHNLTASLLDGHYCGAGGKILPDPAFLPPSWLSLAGACDLGGALAFFDRGGEAKDLAEPPYGTNMAFHRSVFERCGGFRTDLGPRPGSEIRNEDTEFGRRVLAGGGKLRYEPSAIVYHAVTEKRTQQQYFLRWYFDFGRAMAREWEPGPNIAGIPRRFFTLLKLLGVTLPASAARWLFSWNPKHRFYYKCWVRVTLGQIVDVHRQCNAGKDRSIQVNQV